MRALAASVFLVALPLEAGAAHGVRLTYFGDPATSIAISWSSDDPADASVSYGTSATALDRTATATATAQPAPLVYSFTAHLTGLSPKTSYFYRIGAGATFSFTTLSDDPCDPFRFVLIGDNRNDSGDESNPVWAGVLEEALAHEPGFFVNTGDMVKEGSNAAQWSSFLDASEAGWAKVPSILTMGNHDDDDVDGDGALYNQLYELPRNERTDTEDYFGLDVGPIHFVSLNTQYSGRGTAWTEMLGWLASDLAASDRTWKMVFFHKPIYSRGNHSTGEEDGGAINKGLVPILDEAHVDLVMSGHSHDYERYAPSRGLDAAFGGGGRTFPAGVGSAVPDPVPDGTVGTTYLVTGGAGAITTDIFGFTCLDAACTFCTGVNLNCNAGVFDKDREGCVLYDGRHNFAVVDVAGGMITVQVFTTTTGNVTPAEKIDEFRMVAADATALTCGGGGGEDMDPPPDGGRGGADGAGRAGGAGDGGGEQGGCGCAAPRTGGSGWPWGILAWLLVCGSRARRE